MDYESNKGELSTLLKLGDELEIGKYFGQNIPNPKVLTSYKFTKFLDITTEKFVDLIENKNIENVQLILMSDLYGAFSSLMSVERYDLLQELLNYSVPYYELFELANKLYKNYYLEKKDSRDIKLIKKMFKLPNFTALEGKKFVLILHEEAKGKSTELANIVTRLSNYSSPDTENKYTTLEIQAGNLQHKKYEVRLRMLIQTEYKCMYDVFEKWSLVLPVELFVYRLNYTALFKRDKLKLAKELEEAAILNKHNILNPSVIPCIIRNHGTKFNAYLSRSPSSLRNEGIYVILGKIIDNMPLESVTRSLYGGIELDIGSRKFQIACEKMFVPLIEDIIKWKKYGLSLRLDNIAFVKTGEQYRVRLFSSTFDRENTDLYFTYSLPLSKKVLEFAVNTLLNHEYKLRAMNAEFYKNTNVYKDFLNYFVYKLAKYFENKKTLTEIHSKAVNTIFDVTHPDVSTILEERNVELSVSTANPPNKRLAVDTLFTGVNLFYDEGSSLLKSIENGDDYLLKYVSNKRLLDYMNDSDRGYKLIKIAAYACTVNSSAFIYILTYDDRKRRDSYEKYVKNLLRNIQAVNVQAVNVPTKPRNYNRNVIVEKNLYVKYKGPGFEKFK